MGTVTPETLAWCAEELGPVRVVADCSKQHPGHGSSMLRLRTGKAFCFLKEHDTCEHWGNEIHAYENWVGALGDLAPGLLAVRDVEPLALVIGELPGKPAAEVDLSLPRKRAVWHAAGAALAALHDLEIGVRFGPCLRGHPCSTEELGNAEEYLQKQLMNRITEALTLGCLSSVELAFAKAVRDLTAVFADVPPVPCHRDYCSANWLVSAEGILTGVIDFEFSHWDVRVNDLARDPDWIWLQSPDLFSAFMEAYGRSLTPTEECQLAVSRALYALNAIVWGCKHSFRGFEREGRRALKVLARML